MPELKGPLGMWNFPLLNFLRETLQGLKQKQTRPQQTPSYSPVLKNIEEITWTDWKGRSRNITVHREVKRVD